MQPDLVTLPLKNIVGIQTRTSHANESDLATGTILPLWDRFFKENIPQKIPNAIGKIPYGIYSDYKTDWQGEYSLTIGMEVPDLSSVPEGLQSIQIVAGDYLHFHADGEISEIVAPLWQKIWDYFVTSSEYERTYTTDFEHYGETGNAVDIFVAVKKR